MRFARSSSFVLAVALAAGASHGGASPVAKLPEKKAKHGWPVYGGTTENNHFSSWATQRRSQLPLAIASPGGLCD